MKRLLVVTDAWHPQVNGVVTVFDNILPRVEERGWEVVLIEPGQFSTLPLPLYPEIRLALFPKRRVQKTLRAVLPDAVHIATEGPLGLAARSLCIANNIPFTTSYHTHFQLHLEAWLGRSLLTPLINSILRWFHRPAAATMVATESLKTILLSMGFGRVVVWPLGADTDFFIRSKTPAPLSLTKPVFGYLGRIAPEKHIEEFLELELPGSKLIIGDGPQRRSLEAKYGKVATFVGYKKGRNLVDFLSVCDVLVFPSRTETFGLVIVEALSMGIPVAAHEVMGPKDIITSGKDGFLSDDLQEAAMRCLALAPADCRAKALQYSWDRSAEVFLENLASARV